MDQCRKISFRLEFPAPPNRANDRSHYWRSYSNKKKYEKMAWGYLMEQWQRLPKEARDTPWPKFTWKMTAEVWSEYDLDNLMALSKWPLDTLKKLRIITDDNPKHAVPSCLPVQEVRRVKDRRVYFDIEFESKA